MPTANKITKIYNKNDPIELLQLPKSIESALRKRNINTIGKLYRSKRKRLYGVKNLGRKSVSYLMKYKRNIILAGDPLKMNPKDTIKGLETKNTSSTWIPSDNDIQGGFVSRKDPLDVLGLPTRIENALRNGGIEKVGEFYDFLPNDLYNLRNLGPKTMEFLNEVKKKISLIDSESSAKIENPKFNIKPPIPEIPKELLIDKLISRCKDPRTIEVVKRRYGLINGEKETLEEIGKDFGITRERIRQLQIKALKKMRHPSVLEKKPILEIINQMLWSNDGIVSAEEADQLMSEYFKNLPYDGSSLLDLLADLEWIDVHNVGDIIFYSPKLGNIALSELMNRTIEILRRSKSLLSVDVIANNFPNLNLDNDKLIKMILRCCRLDPRIEEGAQGKFTSYLANVSRKNLWVSFMAQALEEEGFPLHFTEIANRVNDLLRLRGKYLDQRRTYSLLIETPIFAHTGVRGMYGLTKWGIRKDSTLQLAKEYIKKAGFPVHWEQIYLYVCKYKDTKKVNIKNLLDTSGKFVKKGNGFYWIS